MDRKETYCIHKQRLLLVNLPPPNVPLSIWPQEKPTVAKPLYVTGAGSPDRPAGSDRKEFVFCWFLSPI